MRLGATPAQPITALVLSGGGARGAYQVGVLQALHELGLFGPEHPVEIVVGSSAGSLNAGALAAAIDEPAQGLALLASIWSEIEPSQVFRTDLRSLGGIGARWVRDLSFGGLLRRVAPKALLDTAPLRALLARRLPFADIEKNLDAGLLRALAIPATNLHTGDGVIFVDCTDSTPLWRRGRWSVERTRIGVEHLMASSAIPIFFPSVEIEGRHFGDGSIRNTAPLSPAIHLGAERVVAIGVRRAGLPPEKARAGRRAAPTIAEVAGALLDAVMLDAIEVDFEHSGRVNQSVLASPTPASEHPFRWVDVLWISPSRSFREIAAALEHRIPPIVRYLMRGLGPDDATTELATYLLFDAAFCQRLVEIGRADVHARRDEITAFLRAPRRAPAEPPSLPATPG
ncbi:MAG: Patatin [Proteobacteria bacterium]|nr:MAG: Patatin [Pseudomonadota bacterium]